jgi:integrase
VAATLGTIIERYMAEDFFALRHSTQTTNKSLINLHIKPRWEHVRLADVSAMAVKQWLDKLPFGTASKVRACNMVSKLLELAMLWEYIPIGRNPMELVRVKGSTKRQKTIVILTPADFKALVEALPEPYNLMVLVCGCLGLRVSETLALKWHDFNFDDCTLSINQMFAHGQVQDVPKTHASDRRFQLTTQVEIGAPALQWRPSPLYAVQIETRIIFPSPRRQSSFAAQPRWQQQSRARRVRLDADPKANAMTNQP